MRSATLPETGGTEAKPEQRFSLRETGRILEIPEARLKSLARAGLLAPSKGPVGPISFGFRDLLLLRTTKGLLESGVPLRRIRRIWSMLRKQLANDASLGGISIRAEGEDVIATDGTFTWRPDSGQVVLDFDAPAIVEPGEPEDTDSRERSELPALRVIEGFGPAAARRAGGGVPIADEEHDEPTAEDLYEQALEAEESYPADAIEIYQRVLALDPFMADAHVNLGRLYQQTGERGRAEAHYRDAVRLNTSDPVPHFNLGVLLEEQGRREEAAHAYAQAVNRDADFADAHCNLGLLLESMGRRREAMRHLMAARELYKGE